MREKLLSFEKVSLYRNNRALIRDIDLELYRGEIVTLIGPNGSGKSTTAKLALNILRPSSGKIWRKKGISIGYVPQKLNIDHSFPITIHGLLALSGQKNRSKIDSLLQEAGIYHKKHAQLSDLSGGELQRALLARAVINDPDLLVLDEPLQGVDYSSETELYGWIAKLRYQLNCAILLISHDLNIVMAATNHVICLNGHICCSGPPDNIKNNENYLNLLKGRPLAIYKHNHPTGS